MPSDPDRDVRESRFIQQARMALGDFNPECQVFRTESLQSFLHLTIADINAYPNESHFTLYTWPKNWQALLILGVQVRALAAQILHEQPQEFAIEDQGVCIAPPPVVATMRDLHTTLLHVYQRDKELIKQHYSK